MSLSKVYSFYDEFSEILPVTQKNTSCTSSHPAIISDC